MPATSASPSHAATVRPSTTRAGATSARRLRAGTIDSDYRGEVQVLLVNLGEEPFVIERGMRIAQMVIAPVTQVAVHEAETASETTRGAGGFGSTGVR